LCAGTACWLISENGTRTAQPSSSQLEGHQTIFKRGYRLLASIQPVNDISASDDVFEALETRAVVRSGVGWKVGVGIAVVFVLVALLQADAWRRAVGKSKAPVIRSVAVLPFRVFSTDSAQDDFADSMTEELIAELSRQRVAKVVSRTSILHFKNTDKRMPEIARELDVDGIVEGSVLRSGDRVRIAVRLIITPGDAIVWAQIYDRNLRDVMAVQSDVANAVADEVRVQIAARKTGTSESAN
jgi:TolB-like protein